MTTADTSRRRIKYWASDVGAKWRSNLQERKRAPSKAAEWRFYCTLGVSLIAAFVSTVLGGVWQRIKGA